MRRFDFDERWRVWNKASVFSGSLSLLVNRIPTKEVSIQRGSRSYV